MSGRRRALVALVLVLAGAATACRTGRNYPDPEAPRYAGGPGMATPCPAPTGDTLRIVTFNIEFAERVEGALTLLADDGALRCPDLLLLQEMDRAGAARIAGALGMSWVYYPALFNLRRERDFGNAVLSRWPIEADGKLVLPHRARLTGTQRAATAATVLVKGLPIRVYSVHLATQLELGPGDRREQLQAVLEDARAHPRVVIGGDMNSRGAGRAAVAAGFSWPTEEGPRTATWGRWDHLFLRGLAAAGPDATGTVTEVGGVSDHRPVWVRAVLVAR